MHVSSLALFLILAMLVIFCILMSYFVSLSASSIDRRKARAGSQQQTSQAVILDGLMFQTAAVHLVVMGILTYS